MTNGIGLVVYSCLIFVGVALAGFGVYSVAFSPDQPSPTESAALGEGTEIPSEALRFYPGTVSTGVIAFPTYRCPVCGAAGYDIAMSISDDLNLYCLRCYWRRQVKGLPVVELVPPTEGGK